MDRRCGAFTDRNTGTVTALMLPKLTHSLTKLLSTVSVGLGAHVGKVTLNWIQKGKETKIAKVILKKQNKIRGRVYPTSRLTCRNEYS